MNGNKIINVGSPMKDSDVATKKYVDNRAKITLRGEGYGDAIIMTMALKQFQCL